MGAYAQPTSDIFPDFTETDIEGNDHTLSDYLNDGKTVVIDVFTTWCPICVNSLPGLHELEASYGEDLVFLSFERDPATSNELSWASNNNVTNPVFANSLETMTTWNTIYQPNFFVICPDGSFELKVGGIGSDPSELSGFVDVCLEGETNGVREYSTLDFSILTNPAHEVLSLRSSKATAKYEIYGLTGEMYLNGALENKLETLDISSLAQGLYFLKLQNSGAEIVKKFIKE